MNYLIATLTALLLLGCERSEEKRPAEATVAAPEKSVTKETSSVEAAAVEPTAPAAQQEEAKPTGLQKTIAPALPPQKRPAAGVNGPLLFAQKCASCHGQKAEKSALGKSQVIAGWETSKVEAALNGYKEGSYGGPMKGLMTGQVSALSEAEIKALSIYIHSL